MRRHCRTILVALAFATPGWFLAATPPGLVHYQGVLRDASGRPLDGPHEMTFRFLDAPSGGDLVLIDAHTGPIAIPVSSGLFEATLGGGVLSDGPGPGFYNSLDSVFRDHEEVWLELEVGGETLAPRVHIVAVPTALNVSALGGRDASRYLDVTSTPRTKGGPMTLAPASNAVGLLVNSPQGGMTVHSMGGGSYADVVAASRGMSAGGSWFGLLASNEASTAEAYAATENFGMEAQGPVGGGHFTAAGGLDARLAHGGIGIEGYSPNVGGSFEVQGGGRLLAAAGPSGMLGSGDGCGVGCAVGHFADAYYTGRALLVAGDTGVLGNGTYQGGEFRCDARSGWSRVGFGDWGIEAYGAWPGAGGFFADSQWGGHAWAGSGGYGTWATGAPGGTFTGSDQLGWSNQAGTDGVGLRTETFGEPGPVAGVFVASVPGATANVVYVTGLYAPYSISGTGVKAFVQNDPEDRSKEVVYVALEGDETGTYTRGTARLSRARARVALDPSFALVTNPDVGLTAHVTSRGAAVPLAVESVSTEEIVVRAPDGMDDDIVFDYVVIGLRLGFEHLPAIQERSHDARLPPAPVEPAAPSSALSRFSTMASETGIGDVAMPGAAALLAAARATGAASARSLDGPPAPSAFDDPRAASPSISTVPPVAPVGAPAAPPAVAPLAGPAPSDAPVATPTIPVPRRRGDDAVSPPVPLAEPVTAGLLVAAASDGTGLVPATGRPGECVVGIVGGQRDTSYTVTAPLAVAGSVALVRVAADAAPISAGDLLEPSPLPGVARRVDPGVPRGRAIAKALDPLPSGSGLVRALVLAR